MTRDEIEALSPKKTKTIEIEDFVDLDEIDPIYFDQPYYLGPATGAERAYKLLVEAMGEQRKVAIARFVLRNKENLCAIRSTGDVLTLATMRFADEVVPPDALDGLLGDAAEIEPKDREIEMAGALIESLTAEFDPSSYKDEYRDELLGLIERKARGEVVAAPEAESEQPTSAPDLMAALEQSLAAVKSEDLGAGAKKKPAARKPAAKKPAAKSKPKPKAKKSPAKAKSK